MRIRLWLAGVFLLMSACAGKPPAQPTMEQTEADVQAYISSEEVTDDRGRFREIFCAVLEDHGRDLPDYRSCEKALRTTGAELGATGEAVPLGRTASDYLVLMVPGLGWNCFAEWLDLKKSVPEHLARFGYEIRLVPVDGLSSTTNNAAMIHDYVAGLPAEDADRRLILIGYSKGTPDILTAVVEYPMLANRVDAVVSLAGAVGGSPLSENATQAKANMLTVVPGSQCEEEQGDNDAVNSLRPDVRKAWLAANPLPPNINYYSAITFPEPDRISWALKNSYLLLGETDIRNDTQLVIFDQFVPGSKVFAVVNADHWAIAVPVARSHSIVGGTLVNRNDYPREAFMEALLRYVEADLAEN
jgi:triacylglycerol esterase/lipase EstA (alpha/beta hydrolase family)